MDSTPNTDRKGFLKRAGLAIASVFAFSAASTALPKSDAEGKSAADGASKSRAGARTEIEASLREGAESAFDRIRTAKGTVPRSALSPSAGSKRVESV